MNQFFKLASTLIAGLSLFIGTSISAQNIHVEIIKDGSSSTGTTPAVFNDEEFPVLKCYHAILVDRSEGDFIFILKLSGRVSEESAHIAQSYRGSTKGVLSFENGNSYSIKIVVLNETPDNMKQYGLVEMRLAYSPISLLADNNDYDYVKRATADMIYSNLVSIKIGSKTIPFKSEGFRTAEQFTAIWNRLQSAGAVAGYNITADVTKQQKPATSHTATSSPHEWVDLGLSVKWASCNLGASLPSDYGHYFAWGEVSAKKEYSWKSYSFWTSGNDDSTVCFSKYNTTYDHGTVDNRTRLVASDDAACQKWGGQWRIPTKREWIELYNECTWTWTSQNGHNGYRVTSKKNGKSIFLPAAGMFFMKNRSSINERGEYWSSELDDLNRSFYAQGISFDSTGKHPQSAYRFTGLSIRPVTD